MVGPVLLNRHIGRVDRMGIGDDKAGRHRTCDGGFIACIVSGFFDRVGHRASCFIFLKTRPRVTPLIRFIQCDLFTEGFAFLKEAADIVASRTGIVEHTLVKNGRSLVKPGSAVLEGEKLVTGAVDSLSHPTRYLRASAEIWADTWYQETALEPESYEQKTELRRSKRRFALRFGKKRINCFSGSRKELDGYDKIVHEYKLGVEGLFSLPLSLTVEEYRLYERQSAQADRTAAQRRLRENLTAAVEGEILQSRLDSVSRDGWLYTELRAHCHENIARTAEVTPP